MSFSLIISTSLLILLTDFSPITDEDLSNLGVESGLIPSVVSLISRVELSQGDSPQLNEAEAEALVDVLDKVCLSTNNPQSLANPMAIRLRRSTGLIQA